MKIVTPTEDLCVELDRIAGPYKHAIDTVDLDNRRQALIDYFGSLAIASETKSSTNQ